MTTAHVKQDATVPQVARTGATRASKAFLLVALCLAPIGSEAHGTASSGETVTSQAKPSSVQKAFDHLLDEQWQYTLKNSPEMASQLGDERYNDRWSDVSPAHYLKTMSDAQAFLDKFRALAAQALTPSQRTSRAMIIEQLETTIEGVHLKTHEMPLNQITGLHLMPPGLVPSLTFATLKNYQDYAARLKALPAFLDQVAALARQGERDGLMPPRFLLEKTVRQVDQIAEAEGMESPFAAPVKRFASSLSAHEQTQLRAEILTTIDDKVRPAYGRLAHFMRAGYIAHGRREDGIWALPNGAALYRYAVKTQTTTSRTPTQIHALGLAQVAHIEAQMTELAHRLGFADLAALRASVATNPQLKASSREQILAAYRQALHQMWPALPRLFSSIPGAKVEVRPVERYREAEAPGAEYHEGTRDGSRPGIIFVNTGQYAQRDLYTIEDTAYHEGVPGHHFQISWAHALKLPPFRQLGMYNAYIEGWGLYAERLGRELGFYQDPYSDYGRLNGELLRAERLVLDTGVHDKHWTRAQMIAFFHAHPSTSEPDIQAETDRYIAWPGQALGYMLGQQMILTLRHKAQAALGPAFDLKAFHEVILGGGAMPLTLLSDRVEAWIDQTRKRAHAPV